MKDLHHQPPAHPGEAQPQQLDLVTPAGIGDTNAPEAVAISTSHWFKVVEVLKGAADLCPADFTTLDGERLAKRARDLLLDLRAEPVVDDRDHGDSWVAVPCDTYSHLAEFVELAAALDNADNLGKPTATLHAFAAKGRVVDTFLQGPFPNRGAVVLELEDALEAARAEFRAVRGRLEAAEDELERLRAGGVTVTRAETGPEAPRAPTIQRISPEEAKRRIEHGDVDSLAFYPYGGQS